MLLHWLYCPSVVGSVGVCSLQMDSLAAAVNAGALQQKKLETSSTHSGEQFNLDMSCNPAAIAQRLVGKRF